MIKQEVEVAVVMIVRTSDPGFWKARDVLAAGFGERAKEIQEVKFHNFGVPQKKFAPTEIEVEFSVIEPPIKEE